MLFRNVFQAERNRRKARSCNMYIREAKLFQKFSDCFSLARWWPPLGGKDFKEASLKLRTLSPRKRQDSVSKSKNRIWFYLYFTEFYIRKIPKTCYNNIIYDSFRLSKKLGNIFIMIKLHICMHFLHYIPAWHFVPKYE